VPLVINGRANTGGIYMSLSESPKPSQEVHKAQGWISNPIGLLLLRAKCPAVRTLFRGFALPDLRYPIRGNVLKFPYSILDESALSQLFRIEA